MIWIVAALAGGTPCEKMSDAEQAEVSDWLAKVVAPIHNGQHPTQDDINFTENLWAADRLCTPNDRYFAATIMAFGFSKGSTEAAYSLAKTSMAEGTPGAPQLVASIYDRYLVVRAKPQRYATMTGGNQQGKACLFPIDPADDAERAQYGLAPLEDRFVEFSTGAGYAALKTYSELGQHQAICPERGNGKKLRTASDKPKGLGGARAMQITGISLTIPGAVLLAGGGGLFGLGVASASSCDPDPDEPSQCGLAGGIAAIGGIGIAITSVPFLASGVPLWIVGGNKVKKLRRPTTVTAQLTPMVERPGLRVSGTW